MKFIKYAVITFIVLLLQTTLVNLISIKTIKPDLPLLLVIFISLKEGRVKGTLAGFLIGLFEDFTNSTSFIGLSALTKSIAGFVSSYFNHQKGAVNFLSIVIIGLVTITIHHFIYYAIFIQGSNLNFITVMLNDIIPSIAYTLVTGIIIFSFIFIKEK